MTKRTKKILAIALLAAFIAASVVLLIIMREPLKRLIKEPAILRDWIAARGVWGRLAFLGIMILQVFIAIIPGEPLEIAAGYSFGAIEGTALCLLGQTLGSALAFIIAHKLGRKAVTLFISEEKLNSVKFIRDKRKLTLLTAIVYLIPGTPKDVLCYAVGLTDMRLTSFLLISMFCRIPSVITSTIGGNALGVGKNWFALVAFAIAALLAVGGFIAYRKINADKPVKTRRICKSKRFSSPKRKWRSSRIIAKTAPSKLTGA